MHRRRSPRNTHTYIHKPTDRRAAHFSGLQTATTVSIHAFEAAYERHGCGTRGSLWPRPLRLIERWATHTCRERLAWMIERNWVTESDSSAPVRLSCHEQTRPRPVHVYRKVSPGALFKKAVRLAPLSRGRGELRDFPDSAGPHGRGPGLQLRARLEQAEQGWPGWLCLTLGRAWAQGGLGLNPRST
jgi:hypothetical protein